MTGLLECSQGSSLRLSIHAAHGRADDVSGSMVRQAGSTAFFLKWKLFFIHRLCMAWLRRSGDWKRGNKKSTTERRRGKKDQEFKRHEFARRKL